jgi:hypothetical protein
MLDASSYAHAAHVLVHAAVVASVVGRIHGHVLGVIHGGVRYCNVCR